MYFNDNEFIQLLFTHMLLFIFFITRLCIKWIHVADTSFTFAKRRTRYARLVTGALF